MKSVKKSEINDIELTPAMQKQLDMLSAISDRIRAILKEKKLTHKDFAILMGKTESEVSRWLSRTHNMNISTIAQMSVVLGEDIIMPTKIKKRRGRKPSKKKVKRRTTRKTNTTKK